MTQIDHDKNRLKTFENKNILADKTASIVNKLIVIPGRPDGVKRSRSTPESDFNNNGTQMTQIDHDKNRLKTF
jgi:hypothetical protein